MEVIYKYDNKDVDFNRVALILEKAFSGRKFLDVDRIKESFLNSSHVVYAYIDNLLIGFARAISDSTWAIIYNVALDPKYQGLGIGKEIIRLLVKTLGDRHIFTFTQPRTISLYEHLGFQRSKMAFKYVANTDKDRVKFQENEGFFLSDGFLYKDEENKESKEKKDTNISIQYKEKLSDSTFKEINSLLEKAFKSKRDLLKTQEDFLKSSFYEFAFVDNKLIGVARLLTDHVGEAILLNVAVDPDYQGLNIGTSIVNKLCAQAKDYDIFIHTHPKALGFYNNQREFKRYKTAFSYIGDDTYDPKFFLPNGYRHQDELDNKEIKYYKGKIYD